MTVNIVRSDGPPFQMEVSDKLIGEPVALVRARGNPASINLNTEYERVWFKPFKFVTGDLKFIWVYMEDRIELCP